MPPRLRNPLPVCLLLVAAWLPAGCGTGDAQRVAAPRPPGVAGPAGQRPGTLVAAPAPAGLATIDYRGAPPGLPADPAPGSTAALTEALHPARRVIVYDAPGGTPRAFLPPEISGVPVTVPIVQRRAGWVAVLLPSVNRRVGWLAATGWAAQPLRDQLIVRRGRHELSWLRDGVLRGNWTVATGAATTPTPLGRTFVLGRTATPGAAYGGLDALALGSVPDDQALLPPGLRGAHTGIHSWHDTAVFGRAMSNGCLRVPRAGQRTLLAQVAPGTPVTVLD